MKKELLYKGKVKSIWKTEDPGLYVAEYSDAISAGDGAKRDVLAGKGELLNRISSILFTALHEAGVDNHFVRKLDDRSQLVRAAELVALEVVVRNRAAGSICRRLGLEQGLTLEKPLVEFFYKNDDLGDPLLTIDHVEMLDLATAKECQELAEQALAVNKALKPLFADIGLELVDFKLEFGRDGEKLLLIDEFSPDTCRLWQAGTMEGLDKDRFRNDSGDVLAGYREVLRRLEGGSF
ncbi:MAG: phosphoribosylaminoimidazolesuccinocarboxamide synthase [Firmicutes bacterium]|nr:phosphoribosylaminoimidazolesuccinocarboxamide synthase [Bacillota bacterium]